MIDIATLGKHSFLNDVPRIAVHDAYSRYDSAQATCQLLGKINHVQESHLWLGTVIRWEYTRQ